METIFSFIFTLIASLFPFIFILAIVGISLVISYYLNEEKRTAWAAFARSKGLNFFPGNFILNNMRVFGSYRGYHLDLATHKQGKYTYTKMQVYPALTNRDRRKKAPAAKDSVNVTTLLAAHGLPKFYKQPEASAAGDKIFYSEGGVIKNAKDLQLISDLLCDIADGYAAVLAMGGQAVPELQSFAHNPAHLLRQIAVQLLKDIAAGTTANLKSRASHLLCPHCLTHFGPHNVKLSWWQTVTWYGCRSCGQSREFFYGNVTATLDNQMPAEQSRQKRDLRINWLARRAPFDFDAVEIARASDEDVERFAVQLGNDTDPLRKARYPQMRCLVSPEAHLSLNTLRILQRTFGQIETHALQH